MSFSTPADVTWSMLAVQGLALGSPLKEKKNQAALLRLPGFYRTVGKLFHTLEQQVGGGGVF
jgi:hypothetical protein